MKFEPLSPNPEDELYKKIFDFWDKLIISSFLTLMKIPNKHTEAQTNDKGEIAVKYRQPGNVLLQDNPSGREYVAVTQANICMAWIDPVDVDFILAKRDGCCGKKQQSFSLANEADVRRWTNKGGQ